MLAVVTQTVVGEADPAFAALTKFIGPIYERARRGADAPVVETFMEWLRSEPEHVDQEEWRLRAAMFAANPSSSAAGSAQAETLARTSARVLGAELGVAPDRVAVRVAAGAIGGVYLQYELFPAKFDDSAVALEMVRAAVEGAINGVKERLGQVR